MYILRQGARDFIHSKKTNREIAYTLGVTEGYVSQIINCRKLNISKLMAYAFCKAISSDLEIEDIFIIK